MTMTEKKETNYQNHAAVFSNELEPLTADSGQGQVKYFYYLM
jgi:hypothetical protein